MTKYNHAYTFAFSLESFDPDGDDVLPHMLRQALVMRAAEIDDDEMVEATGAPWDTYEVQS